MYVFIYLFTTEKKTVWSPIHLDLVQKKCCCPASHMGMNCSLDVTFSDTFRPGIMHQHCVFLVRTEWECDVLCNSATVPPWDRSATCIKIRRIREEQNTGRTILMMFDSQGAFQKGGGRRKPLQLPAPEIEGIPKFNASTTNIKVLGI